MKRDAGTGTIEELPSGKFRGRLPGRGGKKLPARATREEAERDLQVKLHLVSTERLRPQEAGGTPIASYGRRVLQRRLEDGYRAAKHDLSRWTAHVEATPLGRATIEGVTRADVVGWMRDRLKARTRPAPGVKAHVPRRIARSVVIDALRILRVVFHEAVDVDELRKDDPTASVKVPRDQGRTHDPWTYLRPPEVAQLLEAARKVVARDRGGVAKASGERARGAVPLVAPDDLDAAVVALYTGMREGELWALHARDVDLARGRLVVRYGGRRGEKLLPTKGRRPRVLQLLPPAAAALARQLARVAERSNPLGLVFPSHGSSHVGAHRAPRAPKVWARWMKAAKLTPEDRGEAVAVTWHSLRHTFATLALAGKLPGAEGEGWRIEMVSAYLGHSAIAVTQRYADVAELL